ncbi:MAG: DUF1461 domain-containing protein [Agarilytica sp.]
MLTFFVALALAWAVLAKFDFFYGVWHDYGGLKEGIESYGPKNRFKPGFAETTRQQRVDIFHEINVAVHRSGQGLEEITYLTPTSQGQQKLLREPEVVHLNDVAKLLDLMIVVVGGVLIAWSGATVYFYKTQGRLPKIKHQLVGLGALLLFLFLVLVMFGAENIFNTLHIWVFPKDHQWFFYYQESLMSTMMLAPLLFAWIGAAWLVLSIAIYILIYYLMEKGAQLI